MAKKISKTDFSTRVEAAKLRAASARNAVKARKIVAKAAKTPAEVAVAIENDSPVTEAEFAEFKAEILRLLKQAGIDPAGEGEFDDE